MLAQPGPHDFGPFMFLSLGAERRGAAPRVRRPRAAALRRRRAPLEPRPRRAAAPAGAAARRLPVERLPRHATATLIAELLELHDRERFEVRLYSYGPDDGTPMRRRLVAAFDAFVDVGALSDREAAQRIRADGVDILVDLKGYTLDARTGIVALRPAPVQVAYLGYPGTMAAPFIDYVIVDPVVAPPSMATRITARSSRGCPTATSRTTACARSARRRGRAACGLPEDGFVFCCFNHTYKITPRGVRRLDAAAARRARQRAVAARVNAPAEANLRARGERARRRSGAAGLRAAVRRRAPRAATATPTCSSTRCPTTPTPPRATRCGRACRWSPARATPSPAASRRACCRRSGLPELVTDDLGRLRGARARLAGDPARVAALRARLRVGARGAPLFDSARFAREIEALFARMSERRRAGLAPDYLPARRIPRRPGSETASPGA